MKWYAVAVGVEERRGTVARSGSGTSLGLEGLVEDGARQQIAHLDAHERLAAARVGFETSTSMQW
jgi:hypothetical protein